MKNKAQKRNHLMNQKIILEILKNKEKFEKYIMSDKVFASESIKRMYAEKVIAYVRYLCAHNYKLNSEQQIIVKKCKNYVYDEYMAENSYNLNEDGDYDIDEDDYDLDGNNYSSDNDNNYGDEDDYYYDGYDLDDDEYYVLDEEESYDYENNDEYDEIDELDEFDKRKNVKIRNFIMSIALDEEKFNEFIEGKMKYEDISIDDLKTYLEKDYNIFYYYLTPDLMVGNNDVMNRLKKITLFLTLNPDITEKKLNFKINKDLENKILGMVQKELLSKKNRTAKEDMELAVELYNALNNCVAYDEKLMLQSQGEIVESPKMTELKKVYFKNPKKVSAKDNRVICKNWSQLYVKLLRNNGITSYVTDTKYHTNAVIVDKEHNLYVADGTYAQDQYLNEKNVFLFPDIVRSKLGLRTINFYKIGMTTTNRLFKEYYRNGEFVKPTIKVSKQKMKLKGQKIRLKPVYTKNEKKLFNDFLQRALNNEPINDNECDIALKILKIIEETGRVPEQYMEIGNEENKKNGSNNFIRIDENSFDKKMKLISRICLSIKPKLNDDNLANRILSSNLCFHLLNMDNIQKFESLYKVDKNGNVKMLPVIYGNIHTNQNNYWKNKEVMYIFDESKGFVKTTRAEIKKKLNNKNLFFNYYKRESYYNKDNSIEDEIRNSPKDYSAFDGIR